MRIPKFRLTPGLLKFAYNFIDVEASAQTAALDGRVYEYAYVIQKLSVLPKGVYLMWAALQD